MSVILVVKVPSVPFFRLFNISKLLFVCVHIANATSHQVSSHTNEAKKKKVKIQTVNFSQSVPTEEAQRVKLCK